jgi:hypothetical protein
MSKIVFRNYDIKAIRELLKEIGSEHYKCALKDNGLDNQPPMSMKGFFIEYEVSTQNIKLYYKYPSNVTFFIMNVLGYWHVPSENWKLMRVEGK